MTALAQARDAAGRVRRLPPDEAWALWDGGAEATPLVWIHLDANDPQCVPMLRARSGLNDIVIAALVATETRPRAEVIGAGALVNLRGLAASPLSVSDSLASIRLWADRGRVISVYRHALSIFPRIDEQMARGAIRDPGDLITAFAVAITAELDPEVAALGDALDDCEEDMDGSRLHLLRSTISRIRARAIGFRRFVAPQHDALQRLSMLDADWLEDEDRLHLSEAADRASRMAEELEAVRERAVLTHEQIMDLRSEQIETRALLISVVALVFLPLTFITGLLGMNVEGIPWAREPWAFWGVVGVCAALAVAVTAYFVHAHWFRR